MKLKEFNIETCISVSKMRTPSIRINVKGGLVGISKSACLHMGLNVGNQVIIHQDEEAKQDWYLEVVSKNGFTLRSKSDTDKALFFNNTILCKAIASSVDYKENCGSLLIAGKPTNLGKRTLWGLLTISLKKARK